MSLGRSVDHAASNRFHHIIAGTHALRAELRADAALHVASAQRQERHQASDEPLLNDGGFKEATCRGKKGDTQMEPFSSLHLTLPELTAAQAELQLTGKLAYLID